MQLMNIPFCSSAVRYVLLAWGLIEHGVSLAFAFMGISHRAGLFRRSGILRRWISMLQGRNIFYFI